MEIAGPNPSLPRFVEQILVADAADARCTYVRVPDARVDLVLVNSPYGARLFLVGTRTEPLRTAVPDAACGSVVLRFKPGSAYPFFGVPVSALTDHIMPLEELWGPAGRALGEQLSGAACPSERAQQLETALHARLSKHDVFEPAAVPSVRRAMKLMHEANELPRVRALADQVGLSERQLRRAFDQVVGVGPKVFGRIVRLRRAMGAARSAPLVDWSALAEAHGYYDQAHLIAECRALTGFTPEQARQEAPALL